MQGDTQQIRCPTPLPKQNTGVSVSVRLRRYVDFECRFGGVARDIKDEYSSGISNRVSGPVNHEEAKPTVR